MIDENIKTAFAINNPRLFLFNIMVRTSFFLTNAICINDAQRKLLIHQVHK